jgi:hypothetical protein
MVKAITHDNGPRPLGHRTRDRHFSLRIEKKTGSHFEPASLSREILHMVPGLVLPTSPMFTSYCPLFSDARQQYPITHGRQAFPSHQHIALAMASSSVDFHQLRTPTPHLLSLGLELRCHSPLAGFPALISLIAR